jgi:hypothetical protein
MCGCVCERTEGWTETDTNTDGGRATTASPTINSLFLHGSIADTRNGEAALPDGGLLCVCVCVVRREGRRKRRKEFMRKRWWRVVGRGLPRPRRRNAPPRKPLPPSTRTSQSLTARLASFRATRHRPCHVARQVRTACGVAMRGFLLSSFFSHLASDSTPGHSLHSFLFARRRRRGACALADFSSLSRGHPQLLRPRRAAALPRALRLPGEARARVRDRRLLRCPCDATRKENRRTQQRTLGNHGRPAQAAGAGPGVQGGHRCVVVWVGAP